MTNHVKHISLAIGLASLAWPHLAAQAQTYTQLSAGVTGLRYTLVDLAPDDGITPALTWTTGTVIATASHAQAIPNVGIDPATYDPYAFDGIEEFPSGARPNDYVDVAKFTDAELMGPGTLALLGSNTISVGTGNGNGLISMSSTGITSSARVTADQVRTQQVNFETPASPSGYPPGFAIARTVSYASTSVDGRAAPDEASASFTLTPNTAVRFNGTLYLNGQFDAATLVEKMNATTSAAPDFNDYYAYIGGTMGASVNLSGGDPMDVTTADPVNEFFDAGYLGYYSGSHQADLSAMFVGYGYSGIG